MKRGRSPERSSSPCTAQKRRRATRWGPEKNGGPSPIPYGLPTAITATMTSEQLEAYAVTFRIEEITQKLRTNDISMVSANGNRSPSPAPEYDSSGRRTNTRARRCRDRLENELHQLVEVAVRTIPGYRAPQGYCRPTKFKDKVFVPAMAFPGVNFIGQILGPRGSSLKAMNTKTGASIAIRGRGSVKEGKARNRSSLRATADQHEQEPLHCLITADSQQKVSEAKALLHSVIDNAASTPEQDNTRKCQQLRELAIMNGTFRDDENRNQGYQRPSLPDISQSSLDGQDGHVVAGRNTDEQVIDREYEQLMAEIGGTLSASRA